VSAPNSSNQGVPVDPNLIADSLAQLTSGWSPAPGVAQEALSAARAALAMSLVAGKSLGEIQATQPTPQAGPPSNPQLSAELREIASQAAAAKPSPVVAIVRSARAATLSNPSGVPDWARGAKAVQSFGPFLDLQGVPAWVDLIPFTVSTQFAFVDPSAPFGVFPIVHFLVPPATASQFDLGSGSVWFLAQWIAASLPAGNFTGFSISGGSLVSSKPMSYQSGVYVIPAGATLTVTATLVPLPSPVNTGDPGADAAAAVFTPPSKVEIVFQASSAAFQSIADANAKAYGSSVTLHWNHGTPAVVPNLPEIGVPCTATPGSFGFQNAASKIFDPSGTALITGAAWALPLAATSISALPEVAGPGAAVFVLSSGGSLQTVLQPAAAMSEWLLEIGAGGLYVLVTGKAPAAETTFQLWPESAPSELNATVDFSTNPAPGYAYLSTSTNELLFTAGSIVVHLDRPLNAAGARFPYQSAATLLLDQSKAATVMAIVGGRPDDRSSIIPVALENALLGVDAPELFTVSGTLQGTQFLRCVAGLYFDLRWLLPTLPDPYAANFDLSLVRRESDSTSAGTALAVTTWKGLSSTPELDFVLLPPAASGSSATAGTAATPAAGTTTQTAAVTTEARAQVALPSLAMTPALLDLSTRVDLFGVAVAPQIGALATSTIDVVGSTNLAPAPPVGSITGGAGGAAPVAAFSHMALALNGALVATFALPQFSWEPMESTGESTIGPIECDPASDGAPLLVASPDSQQLVPFAPAPVLVNNIANVAEGIPFAAVFSLPFGLNAVIVQYNARSSKKPGVHSTFIEEGGRFGTNIPRFPNALPPSPPQGGAPPKMLPPANPSLAGALSLSLMPENPGKSNAMFEGFTLIGDTLGTASAYGTTVLQSDVATIFSGDFNPTGHEPGVPVLRVDFTGYGASTFSEWTDQNVTGPGITKVQFDASLGRTSYEVIQAVTVIYPYCIHVVRTITMLRQNAGWVKRSDSGWQASSPGTFAFPSDVASQYANAVHKGALNGAYNVRNIRDQAQTVSVTAPANPKDPSAGKVFEFREVLFDADLVLDGSLNVRSGGFPAQNAGGPSGLTAVTSKDNVGYLQLAPDGFSPFPATLALLFAKTGAVSPAVSCTVEAGRFNNTPGTVLRCSAFEVDMIAAATSSSTPTPAVGVALRGAPQIPRGGGWSMGQRLYTEPAPAALPNDYPVPLVRPATSNDYWYIADVTDILQLTQPNNFYSLLHSTGTHKVLFESPQIPTSASISPPPPAPGLQFPKPNPPGPPKSGSAPLNQGSPNLGDLASILNSTGLFPDIAAAISMLEGEIEQINTIGQGFKYSKTYTWPAGQQATIVDLSVMNIVLLYSDYPQQTTPAPPAPQPTVLTYTVDSSASPSWTLSIGRFSLQVTVPMFGSQPLLTITGGFYGDEHTAPGVTGLNVQFGGALSIVKNVFSDLQTLAQFLPGGASAALDVALSDGTLTVTDTFTIADMPLGLGNLTDISLDVTLDVQLAPLSVNFSVGIGGPDNPFNWIATPLAGNGMMTLGVQNSAPDLTIQAGIGLGIAIDLGIASGSASITIAFQLNIDGNSITLMVILTGQASVSVLDGLASASLTLSAALGLSLNPALPIPQLLSGPPEQLEIPSVEITLLASVSVGIHITICWVVSISWDGSWQFSQSISTPSLTVNV
jgi:hypothetical protein